VEKLTVETLKDLNKKLKEQSRIENVGKKLKIVVHMGTCGLASGAQEIYNTVLRLTKENNLTNIAVTTGEELNTNDNDSDMVLTTSGCAGMCCNEPMMTIKVADHPSVIYYKLTAKKTEKIFASHVIEGKVLAKFAMGMGPEALY
jgi:NADP-reducing hydrogenase subunit HndB